MLANGAYVSFYRAKDVAYTADGGHKHAWATTIASNRNMLHIIRVVSMQAWISMQWYTLAADWLLPVQRSIRAV